jgi:MFS family permease
MDFEITEVRSTTILIMFSVAQLLFSPLTAYIKNKIGSKNTISMGFVLITITTYCLGLITYIDDPFTFFVCGNIVRFIQGVGSVWLQFIAYSTITSVFRHDIMTYIKYIEIAVGLGLGIGPWVGDILFEKTSFAVSMYCFGTLNLITLIICITLIPDELNQTVTEKEIY